VVIVRVSRTSRGPQVIVSRTDSSLLARLFEMEVPEIYEGTVVVKNAVREPGDRAKVAVFSKHKDVDPVGACVGIKGARVQNIIRELRGEKIDIVEWSDDARTFAINALNPAKVSRVAIVDDKEKVMEVIVEDKQLSLAIGKRGQNVRLAARLLGWRIDIKSEEEKKREVQSQMDAAMATAETDVRVPSGRRRSRSSSPTESPRSRRSSRIPRRSSKSRASATRRRRRSCDPLGCISASRPPMRRILKSPTPWTRPRGPRGKPRRSRRVGRVGMTYRMKKLLKRATTKRKRSSSARARRVWPTAPTEVTGPTPPEVSANG
jgi:transcription antitermination factor NusA-like protein